MTTETSSWKLEFKRLPHLDDLQLLHIADVTHDYPRHVHEEYCVAAILRGTEIHICRGKNYTAVAGDILLLNAEEAHANRSTDVEYKSIQFKPRLLGRLAGLRDCDCLPVFEDPIVKNRELFERLVALYTNLDEGESSPLEQESELATIIEMLLRRDSSEAFEPQSVREARDYLRSHYSDNVSLADLASIANLSPFHLVRVFKNQVGVPPHEYQTQIRITKAQRLMRAGHSISDAAIETGFFDQSHFSRNFKRITGLTPGRYLSHSNIVQDS